MNFLTREMSFRDKSYRIVCTSDPLPTGEPQHPSWFSFYDEVEVRRTKWGVMEGDLILDIGAAYGSYALCGLAVGAAKALAWSPPELCEATRVWFDGSATDCMVCEADFMEASARANGWADRLEVFRHGVYDRSGSVQTETQEFSEAEQSGKCWIRVTSLDDQLRPRLDELAKYPRAWMKLDVEGAELHVLKGAAKVIERLRPLVCVEHHKFKIPTIEEDVRQYLESFGYEVMAITPYHSVSHGLYVPSAT